MKNESRLIIIEHPTYEEAVSAAAQEAAMSMAATAPGVIYRQGNRTYLTTSFPLPYIADHVRIDNLSRGGNADEHYNRPLITDHHRAISDYMTAQDDYVLPPLSLCVQEPLRCHVPQSSSAVKMGVLVLPVAILYNITDGQHRARAVRDALGQKDSLADDAIGVTIVVEDDLAKVHQLFFDCAQVKPIPQSLLTAYNKRDPLARLVRDILGQVAVFAGRVEQVSKTVGKSAINLFTLNQLRMSVVEILTGDSSQATLSVKKDMVKMLATQETEDEHRKYIVQFYNYFGDANHHWAKLIGAGDPAMGAVDTNVLRRKYVHCTGTGLIVLGRIGFYLRNYEQSQRGMLIEALAQHVNWSREADIWQGNVVSDGRMNGQRAAVEAAVIRIKGRLGMELTEQEQRREARRTAR